MKVRKLSDRHDCDTQCRYSMLHAGSSFVVVLAPGGVLLRVGSTWGCGGILRKEG